MFYKLGWLLIFSLFLVSCGKDNTKNNYQPPVIPEYSPIFISSDSEFDLFINEFNNLYVIYKGSPFIGNFPPINFYDLQSLPYLSNLLINISGHHIENFYSNGSVMAGVCLSYPSGQREILIDRSVWNQIDLGIGCNGDCFERKQALILHELGHCILNRNHKDDKYQGYKLSIMNSVLIKQTDVVRWESDYFSELFTEDHSHIYDAINDYIGH